MARHATSSRLGTSSDERYERLRGAWRAQGLGERVIERCSTMPPLCPACLGQGQERFLGWNPDLQAFGCGAKSDRGLPQPHVFHVGDR